MDKAAAYFTLWYTLTIAGLGVMVVCGLGYTAARIIGCLRLRRSRRHTPGRKKTHFNTLKRHSAGL